MAHGQCQGRLACTRRVFRCRCGGEWCWCPRRYECLSHLLCVTEARLPRPAFQRSRSMVCFYRNYSVVDLCASACATVLLALASFRQGVRATICEELALQPDLLRELDLGEIGLSPENCEQWFEHAVVAFVGVVAIILVVRVRIDRLVIKSFETRLTSSYLSYNSFLRSPTFTNTSFDSGYTKTSTLSSYWTVQYHSPMDLWVMT